ncbi:class I SAM-dependent methyltransferase [Paraburkholderia sediminicola]|uniref:class I SAM-dependent methyltransferase n=1 Tax=Paraburkholderia sediminicola TaxID=458836 RepID=UPI0038BBB84C
MSSDVATNPAKAELLLRDLRELVRHDAPDLLETFDGYAGEVRFGRALIADDLARLPNGAKILEVGAGSLMLSCVLASEGYEVTALEPVGRGFSHFARLQSIVAGYAARKGVLPELMPSSGEELDAVDRFDYAFSVNVMEHVNDVALVLERVHASLRRGGMYRFMCPNYAFPYEPHFNLPTLLSRTLTEKVMWRWIVRSKNVLDPMGTWRSLNWITVRSVRRICRQRLTTEPVFDQLIFQTFLSRALSDEAFQARRGPLLRGMITGLQRTGLLGLSRLIPVALLPVMDCRITRQ